MRAARHESHVQYPALIGDYIADFAIPARKLVIEIDGGQHTATLESDSERTRALNARGYRVIRFWNNDVLGNLEGDLETIIAAIEAPPPLPDPLRPQGRRGKRGL